MKPIHRALTVLTVAIALAGLVPVLRPGGSGNHTASGSTGTAPVQAQTEGEAEEEQEPQALRGHELYEKSKREGPYSGFTMVMLNVPDIEEAVEYYSDTFEMTKGGYYMDFEEKVMELDTGEIPNFGEVWAGGTMIGFYNDPGQDYASGSMSLMLQVEDIEDFRQRLVDRGVDASPPQEQGWGAKVVYANDDFGNNVSFFEPVDGENDSNGGADQSD